MIGRADIEGSKSNVAMNAWLPQASYPCGNFSDTSSFKFRRSKGSIGHAFTVRIRTENQNQTSFYPFVPHEISVLVELILGHLRYLLTDVPPQPNSPPDNVFRPDRPAEAGLGSKKRGSAPLPIHGISKITRIPLVRTSSESTVRRPGKAPEGAVPSPSPGRHAATRSRRGSSSSSPPTADGFGTGTPVPSPQSQSFSRSYGSILPTSLAYIVPSTRGCSPWRPDAVMSTTGRGRHSVLRIFKGRRGRTGHRATCGALPAAGPYLRLSRFQGMLTLEPFSEDQGRSAVHPRGIPPISFLAPYGFTGPLTRTHVRLLGPCFKTGRMGSPLADAGSAQVRKARPEGRALPATIAATTSPRAYRRPGLGPPRQSASVRAPSRSADRLSPFHIRPGRIAGPHPLPSRQFQALFDSLFKVLFIFPSRYLFAIGLSPVFSLGRNLPPDLGCIPKQPDSQTAPRGATGSGRDGALTLSGAPFQGTWARSVAEDASPDYNSDVADARFSSWALPGSLAVTRGILRASPGGACTRVRESLARRRGRATGAREACSHHRSSRPGRRRTRISANRERGAHGRPVSARPTPLPPRGDCAGGQRCVTPRQTCPRPNGLGRNLRSKTRWFTGFCNSHQVSHFATFFIDARAEISVAESRFGFR
ncbi:Regulator of rDNA transcription protein 15 [Melia azedarach]|nr:Regulator of rDNA transcription protein 15 [Melia azedarach]